MIAGNNNNRDPPIRELAKLTVHQVDDLRRHTAPEEQIAAVNEQVRPGFGGATQHATEIVKKIVSSAPAFDSRSDGVIKTKMGIGKEYYSNFIFRVHSGELYRDEKWH